MIQNTRCIEAVNNGKDVPKRIPGFDIEYISTDGWRGYYNAKPDRFSEWTEVKYQGGWMTGDWDDAGENASSKVEEKLKKLDEQYQAKGLEMCVVFTPTSNVFSTAFQVFTRPLKDNK